MFPTSQRACGLTLAAAFFVSLAVGWEWRPLPPPVSNAAQTFKAAATNSTGFVYQRRLRLLQAATQLNREQVVTALERERLRRPDILDDQERTLPTEALLVRYAELDPALATGWLVQAYPVGEMDDKWLEVTLDPWLSQDQKAALRWAEGLPNASKLRERVVKHLIDRLFATDPAMAAQQAAALHADPGDDKAIYAKLAERNLPAACSQAAQLPAIEAAAALDGIMEFWGAHDGAAAYAWVRQLPAGDLRDTAMFSLYSAWAQRDAPAAAAFLTAHRGADLERQANSVINSWAEHDPEAATRWCEQLPSNFDREARRSALAKWAESDPRAATMYAFSQNQTDRKTLLDTAVGQWALAHRADALAWAQSLPPGSASRSVFAEVCEAWAQTDPQSCLEYLVQQPDQNAVAGAMTRVIDTWTRHAPDELWQWSRGLADPDLRKKAGLSALSAILQEEPARVSVLLAQLPADQQAQLSGNIASVWVRSDLGATQKWVSELPAGQARDVAFRSLITDWSVFDPTAAKTWIAAQPAGAGRDAGILALVEANPQIKPPDAIELARSMQNPRARSAALSTVASRWLQQDQAEARVWIAQSPDLLPEERAALLGNGHYRK